MERYHASCDQELDNNKCHNVGGYHLAQATWIG